MQNKPSPFRQEKMNSVIQTELGEILRPYLSDLPGLTSITRAEVSRDMRWVKIWLSIIGADEKVVVRHLEKNLYDIQGQLNRSIQRKIVPRIQFFVDISGEYAGHLGEIFKQIESEDENKGEEKEKNV
jgi:ribosome-binding factor A